MVLFKNMQCRFRAGRAARTGRAGRAGKVPIKYIMMFTKSNLRLEHTGGAGRDNTNKKGGHE